MRFSVDAHAIGRHLTGNEVYIRNLLEGFAALDQSSEFIAYLSNTLNGAEAAVPERFTRRYVSANSIKRLGMDLSSRLAEDRPDLLHVQYTAPISCPHPGRRKRSRYKFSRTPGVFSLVSSAATALHCSPNNSAGCEGDYPERVLAQATARGLST